MLDISAPSDWPGWYADPSGVHSHQAYWNGEKWTGATRPGEPTTGWYEDPDGDANLMAYWNGSSWTGKKVRRQQPRRGSLLKFIGAVAIGFAASVIVVIPLSFMTTNFSDIGAFSLFIWMATTAIGYWLMTRTPPSEVRKEVP